MTDLKALVVDNSPVIRKILSYVLEEAGCLVQTADDGLQALDCIGRQRPDIIFTDLIMPKIDGEKLCAIIRNTPELSDIFLVVLSGVAMEDNINTMQIGADVCIAKGPASSMKEHIHAALQKFRAGLRGGTSVEGMDGLFPREVTRELLISKKHREVILARMTEGVVELNHQGRIVMANEAAMKLLNMTEAQVLGQSLALLVPQPFRGEIYDWLDEVASSTGYIPQVYGYDNPVVLGERQVTFNLVPVPEDENFFVVVILQDVTRRKLLEQRQRQLEKELQRIQKLDAMSVMACGIAHDFNNLLTVISGNLEMAKFISRDQDVTRLLGESSKALDLTVQLIRQFTTFSDNYLPQKSQVYLGELIEEVLSRELSGTSIRYRIMSSEEHLALTLDPSLVRQMFANLTMNAIESIAGPGTITVHIDKVDGADEATRTQQPLGNGEFISVAFHDSGPGVAPHIADQVFDPYFSTKQKGAQKGMGLGLTIVHSTVKKHGGLVWLESPSGGGCTVHLYFPLQPDRIDIVFEAGMQGRGKRVLVMDDEDMMRLINKKMFEHYGCTVSLATTGEEAVALFEGHAKDSTPFDLVLLDLWIDGGMGGLETARRIKEIDPDAVLIAISGDGGHEVMQRFNEHNFTAAIAKPFSIDAVEGIVRRFF